MPSTSLCTKLGRNLAKNSSLRHLHTFNASQSLSSLPLSKNINYMSQNAAIIARYSTQQSKPSQDSESTPPRNPKEPKVKIYKMMDEDDFSTQDDDASARKQKQAAKNQEDNDFDTPITMKGTLPFQSLEEMLEAMEVNWSRVEARTLDFIDAQLDQSFIPDYLLKGLIILYNRTRQYNLQDIVFSENFRSGIHRHVDVDIVNCMIHSYVARADWRAVHEIMHEYFGWSAPPPEDGEEPTGEATDIEPKMSPTSDTVEVLTRAAKDELSVAHLNALLEEFRKQSHHEIINEGVIYGFMRAADMQLEFETHLEDSEGWMGYDGYSMTVQSEVKAVKKEDKLVKKADANKDDAPAEKPKVMTRSHEIYEWIWNVYYTYFGNKMGDYAWIPSPEVVELMIHSASLVGDVKTVENMFETYCQGEGENIVPPTNEIVTSLIRAYGRAGQITKARDVFAKCANRTLLPEGITPDIVEEMIDVCCLRGDIDESVVLLRTYCTSPSEPHNPVAITISILNILMETLRKQGNTDKIISLFEEFCSYDRESGTEPFVRPSTATVNFVMEAYVREGDVDVAFQIFQDYCDPTEKFSVPVSLYTVELIVQGLFQMDQVDKAIGVFETFCIDPDAPDYCKPTLATLHMVLRGLEKKGDANRAIRIFGIFFSGNVPELYVVPRTDTVNILLRTLVNDEDYFKCRDVYEEYFNNAEESLTPNDETREIMTKCVIDEREYQERKKANEMELHNREVDHTL